MPRRVKACIYVGSSALSSGASYLIATACPRIIISMIIIINISVGMRFGAT